MKSWIEKQKYIIDFTLSSLLRRKVKNIGLLILYDLIVFILASVMFFTHAIKKEASLVLRDSPEMIVQKVVAGRHDLMPLHYRDEILKIRGVQAVEGRLWGYYFDPVFGANYTLLVPPATTETEQAETEQMRTVVTESEHRHRPEERAMPLVGAETIGVGNIVVGNGIARLRNAGKGEFILFRTHTGEGLPLRIKDTLSSASELVTSDLILMTEPDFRKLFGIPENHVTDLAVSVRNPEELSTIASKITRLFPESRPIIRDEILRTYESIFNWRGGMMIVILSAAILAFVIFAWDKASGLSAGERREIGILKAIGWETSDIIRMKFWEGAVISMTAFLAGVILAYIHVFFTHSLLFEPALKGWSTLYPQFKLMPFVSAEQLTTLFFLTVVPYTVSTIVPAWRAATIDPDTAMRHTGE
jgi:ABC-type lipoprotein release transport system permease subunit